MGVGCHFLLQEIFLTQGSNPYLFMSPALAGAFFTTQPPGKPIMYFYPYLQSSFLYTIKHVGFALIVICAFPKLILSSPEILGLI